MSGTSLDGLDIAITTLSDDGNLRLFSAHTYSFPAQLDQQLRSIISSQHCALQQLGDANIALGQFIGQSINHLLATKNLSAQDISAIGSHGQTLFHSPNGNTPFSLQIGDANVIAEITGITTVADFRQRDIAAGGQGAPLVPAFHQSVFSSTSEERVIVNIGGISNITILPLGSDRVTGFDTGPGNVLLDQWIKLNQDKSYDESGDWARSGQCNTALLELFLDEPYLALSIPKSTGRELFNQHWLEDKLQHFATGLNPEDIQATLTELTACSIANHINCYAANSNSIFICGGGAHNHYLMQRLQALLVNKQLHNTDTLGLHPDWVEACAFAWLAYRTINQQAGNLAAVTGAKGERILGAIYHA